MTHYFPKIITLHCCDLNIDQSNCDYNSCCNWAALHSSGFSSLALLFSSCEYINPELKFKHLLNDKQFLLVFLKKCIPSENWIKFTAYKLNQSFVVRFLSPFPRLQWPAMWPWASTASHEADYPCKSPQPKQRFPFAQMTQAWSHGPWGWPGLVWMPRLPIFPLCFVSGRWKEGNSNSKWWFVNKRLEMLLRMLAKFIFEEMFLYVLPLLSCWEGSKLFLCVST